MRLEFGFPKELEKAKKEGWPLCIPVGVLEYHAGHCALGCDVLIPYHLLQRFEQQKDIVLAPPIWYGPSSYCVAGPEKNSIHVDCDVFEQYVYNILKSLLYGGWRNFYLLIIHQSEAPNPTELACLKAAKKLLFEYLEDTRGIGWWGKPENNDFADTLESNDNPWNWFKVMPVMRRVPGEEMPLDHAGFNETSLLWAACPQAVDIDRQKDSDEWFCQSAKDASIMHGEKLIKDIFEYWNETIV